MTSYAQAERKGADYYLQVAMRSLNSRYLEIYTYQLPSERIFLEDGIKNEVKKKVNRGRIEIYFFFRHKPHQKVSINEDLVKQYYAQTKKIARSIKVSHENFLKSIAPLPGIIYLEEKKAIDNSIIISAVKETVDLLITFKEKEGSLIKKEILKNLRTIDTHTENIKKNVSKMGESVNVKDIDEEMSLISFYIKKLHKLIYSKKDDVKGKAMDFLSQEILRELNAAASKTKTKNISWWLLDSKSALERIREQSQNIE
ncbi:MAG: DUF1732 domain-containing protein [Candidatus Omnitrophota bacterium]